MELPHYVIKLDSSLRPTLRGAKSLPAGEFFSPNPKKKKKTYSLSPPTVLREHEVLLASGGDEFLSRHSMYDSALVQTISTAFFFHIPLCLRPDDFVFVLMGQLGILKNLAAKDVPLVKDRLGVVHDAEPPEWPDVFQQFEEQIRARIGPEAADMFTPSFSTTGPLQRIAYNVALMDAYSSIFSYHMRSGCGIPSVHLLGTEEDWKKALAHVQLLVKEMDVFVGVEGWEKEVMDIMGKICSSFDKPDVEFWKSIYRHRSESGFTGVSGWITIFFPVIQNEKDRSLTVAKSLKDVRGYARGSEGRASSSFPSSLCSADVKWTHSSETADVRFLAGQIGVSKVRYGVQVAWGWAMVQPIPENAEMQKTLFKAATQKSKKKKEEESTKEKKKFFEKVFNR